MDDKERGRGKECVGEVEVGELWGGKENKVVGEDGLDREKVKELVCERVVVYVGEEVGEEGDRAGGERRGEGEWVGVGEG